MNLKTSHIKNFYKKTVNSRIDYLKEFANLNNSEINLLKNSCANFNKITNKMVENFITSIPLPIGIATNFIINKKEYLIPMATEEPSIIAAASNGAKLARSNGGFFTKNPEPIIIGQIYLTNIKNLQKTKKIIIKNTYQLIEYANKTDSYLTKIGGGAKNLKIKILKINDEKILRIHLYVNTKDAMGANITNTMLETIAPILEKITNAKAFLKIVSNHTIENIITCKATWDKKNLGTKTIDNVIKENLIAQNDIYRCATHNKGIMNGIDAIAIATGNDFRAIEAQAHSYACAKGRYKPLTNYKKDVNGNLVGKIKIPICAGTVGGIIQTHPITKICLKILNVKTSTELTQMMAAVGLAQNFAALKALVTEGIQKGHMRLHKRKNIINLDNE